MKKFFPVLLGILILSGCSVEEKLSSKSTANDVTLNKLSIRQIDSLTAEKNYSFSIRNKIEGKENKNLPSG